MNQARFESCESRFVFKKSESIKKMSLCCETTFLKVTRLDINSLIKSQIMITSIKTYLLFTLAVCFVIPMNTSAQEKSKLESKTEQKSKSSTYPLYGKVVAITSRTLTIVRSNSEDAKESKYVVNSSTEYVNGDKPATAADVKPGKWIGGVVKKTEGDGNDVVVKVNVGVKQREDDGKAKAPKKAAPKKSASDKGEAKKEASKKKES